MILWLEKVVLEWRKAQKYCTVPGGVRVKEVPKKHELLNHWIALVSLFNFELHTGKQRNLSAFQVMLGGLVVK